jgi:Spy/CpxP family protein refolding chaperone
MKQSLLTLATVCGVTALVVGGLAVAAVAGFTAGQSQGAAMGERSHHYCDEDMLEHLPAALNITVGQMDDLRRITERAKPQLVAIRSDARQKRQAIMDATMSDIGPLLTPRQQNKFKELQKARRDEQNAKQKLREALKASELFGSR